MQPKPIGNDRRGSLTGREFGVSKGERRTQTVVTRVSVRYDGVESIVATGKLYHHELAPWGELDLFPPCFRKPESRQHNAYRYHPGAAFDELSSRDRHRRPLSSTGTPTGT